MTRLDPGMMQRRYMYHRLTVYRRHLCQLIIGITNCQKHQKKRVFVVIIQRSWIATCFSHNMFPSIAPMRVSAETANPPVGYQEVSERELGAPAASSQQQEANTRKQKRDTTNDRVLSMEKVID
ncbi:hypothetical protein PoB_006363400 [Plakobranchus ocellatus]|uniref:Uncharacterized protein n=1 Tax=Plakobranchus ocellatus TaxID=259542 RepID=A0AAV4CZ74_9GAST|nr:hypothetical protein PoB_006363400 [Plakobranchus ocellatus]